ncbi:MAG: SAM-dependent methyltransferase [Rikenellaceae bacterium]
MANAKLYMVPCPIAQGDINHSIPDYNLEIIKSLDYFIVENVRSARRFISSLKLGITIDTLEFVELNEHTSPEQIQQMLKPLIDGRSAGVISEAGVPGVADPGADVVALAHTHNIEVIPLVGPSSIILAMMASGLNGQSFAFNGYLPIKQPDRRNAIKKLEQRAISERQSQMFIETPYRNIAMLEELSASCKPNTLITVASDIMGPEQFILTTTAAKWKTKKVDIHKKPAIFIIG